MFMEINEWKLGKARLSNTLINIDVFGFYKLKYSTSKLLQKSCGEHQKKSNDVVKYKNRWSIQK